MKKLILILVALLAMPSITLAAKGGNKPVANDLENRVQYLEDRLQNSDLDNDGYTPAQNDCDDTDSNINPGIVELVPDGIDNNCDGEIDNIQQSPDADGDGFTVLDGDCDDSNPAIFPGNAEICDGLDNDCNGQADDGFPTDTYEQNNTEANAFFLGVYDDSITVWNGIDANLVPFGDIDYYEIIFEDTALYDLNPEIRIVQTTYLELMDIWVYDNTTGNLLDTRIGVNSAGNLNSDNSLTLDDIRIVIRVYSSNNSCSTDGYRLEWLP